MGYVVVKDSTGHCSASKPWSTQNQQTGEILGCHPTRKAALKQSAALYANETDAKAADYSDSEDSHMDTYEDEVRAKYNTADREKMAKAGTAMGDGSYPIADKADLQKAIRAVGRGNANHDSIRKHVITRAKALGLADLIPDNWNSDGSIESKSGGWETDEERATKNDVCAALCSAVSDLVINMEGCYYAWVQDFDDVRVYFQAGSNLYAAEYHLPDDGPAVLNDPVRVRPVTSYVSDERNLGEPKTVRHATKTLEWRKQRAEAISESHHKRSEQRQQSAEKIEVRDDGDEDGPIVLRSYASLFGESYTIRGGSYKYEESVDPSAFRRTLAASPDVVFRGEHSGPPLARTSSGTLRLGTDERGLWYEADLDRSDPDVQSLLPKIRRGDLSESSFAFRCNRDLWNEDRSRRTLQECDLHRGDVSIVTFGASPGTGRHMLLRFEEQIAAIRAIGAEAYIDSLISWRNFTLLSQEERLGKSISQDNQDILMRVLGMVADADENVDEVQILLSDLLSVPNPNESDDGNEEPDDDDAKAAKTETESRDESSNVIQLPASRLTEFEAELRALGGKR